jgi:hypothetical protein
MHIGNLWRGMNDYISYSTSGMSGPVSRRAACDLAAMRATATTPTTTAMARKAPRFPLIFHSFPELRQPPSVNADKRELATDTINYD